MKKHFHLGLIQSLGPLLVSVLGAVGKLGCVIDFREKSQLQIGKGRRVELHIPLSQQNQYYSLIGIFGDFLPLYLG